MSKFEFLFSFMSILLALGVSELLLSLSRLLRARSKVEWHWLPLTWALLIFLLLINVWYGLEHLLNSSLSDTSGGFTILLIPELLLLLVALSILPNKIDNSIINLKEWYFKQNSYIFSLLTVAVCIGIFINPNFKESVNIKYIISIWTSRLSFLFLFLTLAITKKYYIHSIITIIILLVMITILYFQTLTIE